MPSTSELARWQRLLHRLAPRCDPATAHRWYAILVAAYAAPVAPGHPRAYHTLEHVQNLLTTLAHLHVDGFLAADIAQLAAWFHDARYLITAADNEEQSAHLLAQAASDLNLPADATGRAIDLILRTRTYAPAPSHAANLFLDADLAILGAPSDIYQAYVRAIRSEYALYDDETFRRGRLAVLQHFDRKPRLYITDEFETRLAPAARRNLRNEIRSLAPA